MGDSAYSQEALPHLITPGSDEGEIDTIQNTALFDDNDANIRVALLPSTNPDSPRDECVTVHDLSNHGKPPRFRRSLFLRSTQSRVKRRPPTSKYQRSQKTSDRVPAMKLKYHKLKLWLILIYTFGTCLSWTITCILCYRPMRVGSYVGQGIYTKKQYEENNWWTIIARVMNMTLSALTIPITSAICSKAAVAYCQTPPSAQENGLTMRQTLALADKGWSDLQMLARLFHPKLGRRVQSHLLVLSASLCGLGK